jgi:hypothetical protein
MKTQMNLREKHNHKLKYNSLKNIETIRTLTNICAYAIHNNFHNHV